MQVRDWLYVDDHALGVATALLKGEPGQAYNIAGEYQERNINITHRILSLLDKPDSLIKHVPDREGHDLRYAMHCDKLKTLGWERQFDFDSAVEATARWYQENEWWWRKIKTGEYLEYYKRQYSARLAAAE